jgi:dTDP-4-dehydrorhamnose 3,5-epimerase
MEIREFEIMDLLLIKPNRFQDDRGYFMESFQVNRYAALISSPFVQDNVSLSKKGVLRGLHLQSPPKAQGKLVQVLRGSVVDVAVDLRKQSPTYGKHICVELSQSNGLQFYIPPGFAHGFQALEDDTIFTYKCTDYYAADNEMTIRWDDPQLGISWPISSALTSPKDELGVLFETFNSPF